MQFLFPKVIVVDNSPNPLINQFFKKNDFDPQKCKREFYSPKVLI